MPDDDNYPTEEELAKIENWPAEDVKGCLDYCRSIWTYSHYATKWGKTYKFSTGGWSGNESIIGAMKKNTLLWMLTWYSNQRGGHYVFKLQ